MEDWQNAGFAVYIHWPFCQHKCPYCDFNSHVASSIDHDRWRAAYRRAIRKSGEEVPGRQVDTVFFGGGTPSLMQPETVAAVLEEIDAAWTLSPKAEITLEANPTSVEAGKFAAFGGAGVNRVSMGIQSLRDADLRGLGRMHTAAEARAAFDIARAHFERVSFDLIYARQNQTLADWEEELREAMAMAVDHFSLYQLTIEANTRFGELYDRGKLRGLPDDDLAADLYLRTGEICAAGGLSGYEISNYAASGSESRHNLIYWRYGDYVGIGPGAHGRLTRAGRKLATSDILSPYQWLSAVESGGWGRETEAEVAPGDQAVEYLMMSLRLAEGSDLGRFETLAGAPLDPIRVARLQDEGLVSNTRGRLRTTATGRPLLNAVLAELLA